MFTSERPHYSLALFSSFIYTCTTSAKKQFAFKWTLDYFPKKSPKNANVADMVKKMSVASIFFHVFNFFFSRARVMKVDNFISPR